MPQVIDVDRARNAPAMIAARVALSVEDGGFALAIVAWVLAAALCLRLVEGATFGPVLLPLSLISLLAEIVWR